MPADRSPRAGGPSLLEIQDVHAGYGRIAILHDVSLTVGRGRS